MREVDPATLSSLAAKLEALDLSESEQAVLDRLLDRATAYTPEVQGFQQWKYSGDPAGVDLTKTGFQLARGIGVLPGGLGLGWNDPNDPNGPRDPTKPPPP